MEHCDLLEKCGFFQRYQNDLDLACRGFIKTYCKGPKMDDCKRKAYRAAHGAPPHDDMLPTGQSMPKSYQAAS